MTRLGRWTRLTALTAAIAAGMSAATACSEGKPADSAPQPEHAVLIHVPAPADESDAVALAEIEEPIIAALEQSGAGEWDGNEIELATGDAVIYFYGPDADDLYSAIEPVLDEIPIPAGTYVVKHYGDPGAREERIALTE